MSGEQVWELLAFLAAVVIFIPIFYRLKVNPLLAFIVAGIVLGPHMLGLIKDTHLTENIGELGLLFLMFTIGLDLSFHRFKAMRRYIFGFGLMQLLITAAIMGGAAFFMHKTLNASIVIGFGLAMSSTAIAMRLMQEKGELYSAGGRATIGILLMQDLAVIPIMVLIPRMAQESSTALAFGHLGQAFTQAIGAVTIIMIVGRTLVKPLFRIIAATKSPEAFTAVTFFTFLATAWATNMAGLSISLGAFLAGMLIAETDFGHEVESEISSFSGMLLGVFFLSVGMMIDISYVQTHIFQILLLTLGVMTVKFLLLFAIGRYMKLSFSSSIMSSTFLCQAGEFGFVIFNLASQNYNIISVQVASMLQVVIALSMSLTPFLANFVLQVLANKKALEDSANNIEVADNFDEKEQENHIIVVGYGRVGQANCRMLARNEVPFIVVDTDVQHIERAKKNNREYLFGNAANARILDAANISKAKAVVICISGLPSSIKVLRTVREVSSTLPVFIRCNDDTRWGELIRLGATGVISETQECGIRLATATILSLEGDEIRIKETAAILRQESTLNASLPTTNS